MGCQGVRALFEVDRDWSPEEERSFKQHLAECPECRAMVDQIDRDNEEFVEAVARLMFQEKERAKTSLKRPV